MSTVQPESPAVRLADLVSRLGGELVGDPDVRVSRVASLENAGPGDLGFLSHGKYRTQLLNTRASAVVLSRADAHLTALARIVCDDPYLYFARVAQLFAPSEPMQAGIQAGAVVEEGASVPESAAVAALSYVCRGARLGERTRIGPGCYIGSDAVIGDDTWLVASVTVYARSVIGKRGLIHAGAVIGADGFGIARDGERWQKIPQVGRAVIGDDVEIGANTTIDRGALDDTVIEDGVKLDNQIQIGHNVRVGANTAMAGCVGVAGSARIGRNCTVGGGAIILGHLKIVDHVHVSAATLVTKSISRPGTYSGAYPMAESKDWARGAAHLRNIDKLVKTVRTLEQRIADLEAKKRN